MLNLGEMMYLRRSTFRPRFPAFEDSSQGEDTPKKPWISVFLGLGLGPPLKYLRLRLLPENRRITKWRDPQILMALTSENAFVAPLQNVRIVNLREEALFCGDGKVHNNLGFHFDGLTLLVVGLIPPLSDCI